MKHFSLDHGQFSLDPSSGYVALMHDQAASLQAEGMTMESGSMQAVDVEFRKRGSTNKLHAHQHAHHQPTRTSNAVDFTLASTYIPGIVCLLRTSVVIVIMSRCVTRLRICY